MTSLTPTWPTTSQSSLYNSQSHRVQGTTCCLALLEEVGRKTVLDGESTTENFTKFFIFSWPLNVLWVFCHFSSDVNPSYSIPAPFSSVTTLPPLCLLQRQTSSSGKMEAVRLEFTDKNNLTFSVPSRPVVLNQGWLQPPRGMSGDFTGCHSWGSILASDGRVLEC